MSILEKIYNLDKRIIYWIMLAVIILPLITPIGIPLPVSPRTAQFYNEIKNIQPGDVIILSQEAAPTQYPEVEGAILAVTKNVATLHKQFVDAGQPGLKVLVWSLYHPSCLPISEDVVVPILETYGGMEMYEDFVLFPFIPNADAGLTRLAYGIKDTLSADYYGRDLYTIPMLEDIETAEDASLYIAFGEYQQCIGTDWVIVYRVPFIMASSGWAATQMETAVSTGQAISYIVSVKGGAEYEYVSGFPGPAYADVEAISMVVLYLLVLIAISNVVYFATKNAEKGEVKI